jgi:hypothetical protein
MLSPTHQFRPDLMGVEAVNCPARASFRHFVGWQIDLIGLQDQPIDRSQAFIMAEEVM